MKRTQAWLDTAYGSADRWSGGRLAVLLRTALAFDQDDGAVMSRSIAYYALFSFFPLLLILLSVSSALLETDQAETVVVDFVNQYMPGAAVIVQDNIEQVLRTRNTVSIVALLGLLWAATGVFSALYRAVNRAWGNPKSELFWTEKLFGLVIVIIVGLLLVATTLYSTFISIVRSWNLAILDWQPFAEPATGRLLGWLSTLIPALVSVAIFVLIYRTMPRNRVRWRDVWVGGAVAGILWEVARQGYTWYLASFARYSLIYGSVGAIIGFLLWSYLSAMILLLGAELTAQHTWWRRAGRLVEEKPLSEWLGEWKK
jgi:membrane protein